ncbi:MAG: hypothetical protein H7Y88_04045 [Phycisphaerales bacterium]|nr:hypothetical protein [Phycisphaerales bacterium]
MFATSRLLGAELPQILPQTSGRQSDLRGIKSKRAWNSSARLKVPPEGLEPSGVSSGNTKVLQSGGSKSGNKDTPLGDSAAEAKRTDPDLAAVVVAWPDLPTAIRVGVLAMVKAAGGHTDAR